MLRIKRADGGVSLNTDDSDPVRTFEAWKQVADPGWLPATWDIIDAADVPTDRTFRSAWSAVDRTVAVDMPKAVECHKDRLRQMRKEIFERLDAEFLRAIETGNQTLQAAIAAKKQALRNVTADPAITAARTPDELKEAVPAILKE